MVPWSWAERQLEVVLQLCHEKKIALVLVVPLGLQMAKREDSGLAFIAGRQRAQADQSGQSAPPHLKSE